MTLPARVSFTHRGAVPGPPEVCADAAPLLVRRWNARPFPVETSMKACAEPASVVVRIITPAFVHAAAPSIDATRATIVPSPLSGR